MSRQAAVGQRLPKRHQQDHALVLYDLTSSYVEGTHCPLAQQGYSRDRKKGTPQIVLRPAEHGRGPSRRGRGLRGLDRRPERRGQPGGEASGSGLASSRSCSWATAAC